MTKYSVTISNSLTVVGTVTNVESYIGYIGADKLVYDKILNGLGLNVVFWENVKSIDVQRLAQTAYLVVSSEKEEAIGMGREYFSDKTVDCVIYLSATTESAIEGYIKSIRDAVVTFNPQGGKTLVDSNPVVWLIMKNEKREAAPRNSIVYSFSCVVRCYMTAG